MEWQDLLKDGFGRIPSFLEHVLAGLQEEDLNWQPNPDCNSIGWLVWHLTRQQDGQVANLMGEDQLWIGDGWSARFGRTADPNDHGFGHTPEDVAAFRSPDVETLLGYNRAVQNRTRDYYLSLSSDDLSRVLDEPYDPPPTVGVRLVSIWDDATLHAGQAAYVRGLRQGKGWQPY
jgi:hypothetical protein